MKKTLNPKPGTMNSLAGWQGKRREQVEFAATLAAASFAGLFLIAIVLFIIQAL